LGFQGFSRNQGFCLALKIAIIFKIMKLPHFIKAQLSLTCKRLCAVFVSNCGQTMVFLMARASLVYVFLAEFEWNAVQQVIFPREKMKYCSAPISRL
jgi:hypothetical protein